MTFRCGTIAIVGRPNVGKSTLLNALIGQKISITSRKVQTTRYRIQGVYTCSEAQYIFVDTPGFQTRYGGALNQSLNRLVTATLSAADLCLFVVEAGRYDAQDQQVLERIDTALATLLIANKVDRLADKDELLPFLRRMRAARAFCEILPISAKRPEDIEKCRQALLPYLPAGDPIYPEDALTDRSERFIAAEALREKVFRLTGDELPYTSAVRIDRFEQKGGLRRIFATILVERDAHKAIIIGERGQKLKRMGTEARLDLEKLFGGPIYLNLWVKVTKQPTARAAS